ncbi:protein AATF [Xenentodon cancila]
MASSFSQELEDLLNPLPKFADPEDDGDEATRARVIEGFDEDAGAGPSPLRKRVSLLPDTDARYLGKPVSRRQLTGDAEKYDYDDDDEEEEEEEEGEEEEEEGYVEEDEKEDPVRTEAANVKNIEHAEKELLGRCCTAEFKLTSETKHSDISSPQQTDFQKLTDGLDELGVSEEDYDVSEESELSDEGEGTDDNEVDWEDVVNICTLSQDKVDEEVEKGKAVKNQLTLWDQLLEGRIKIQKALVLANQLPQPQTFPDFRSRGGAELTGALKNTGKALKALQRSLLELHDQLLLQNPDTRTVATGKLQAQEADEVVTSDGNEEDKRGAQDSGATKRKREVAEYPGIMAKRFAAFEPYCSTVLQKWHDKTKLTIGKSSKGFGVFERNILSQVEQVLMDNERLVQRTQTRRSEYEILGKKEVSSVHAEGEADGRRLKANTHLKDVDEDIFDDDDFYHQLLRELIECKTSATSSNNQVAMGRQWLAIQKLRSKIKKKVDTKASKGRKVRFHIHSKLVNYMAPIDCMSMSDEACDELYRSLFGHSGTAGQ